MPFLPFHLNFDNWQVILLALVPALINFGILAYVFLYLPRNRTSYSFALFVMALATWQLSDALCRMSVTKETAEFWSRFLAIGALLITPAGLHFTLLFTRKLKLAGSIYMIFLIYFPAILFQSVMCTSLYNVNLVYSASWGWLPAVENNLIMIFEGIWVAGLAFVILILLFTYAVKMWHIREKRFQAILIAAGFAIPTVQGTVTQIIFPQVLHIPPVPVASTFMTAFSVATIIALSQYKLFQVSIKVASNVVLDTITDILCMVSPDGILKFINPAGAEALHIKREDTERFSISELFSDDNNTFIRFKKEVWEKVQKGEHIESYLTSIRTAKKQTIPVLLSASAIPGKDRSKGVLLLAHDITHREKADQLLKTQTALYENLLRAQSEMGEGVAITEGARFVYVNDALCKIYGYGRDELMAMSTFMDIIVPEQRDILTQRLRDRLSGAKDLPEHGETSLIHKNGSIVHISYSLKIFHQGEHTQIFSIIRDITEQRQLEQTLSSQVRITKSIIDQMAEGLIITDEKNNYITVNKFAEKILGMNIQSTPVEKRSKEFGAFLPDKKTPFPAELLPTVRALNGELVSEVETFIRNENFPEGIYVSANGRPIKDENGKIIGSVITFRDITERKLTEKRLRENQTLLSTAQQLAHIGSWEWDIPTNTVTWSDELNRIYGFKWLEADISYEGLLERVHIADREHARRIIEESYRTHKPFSFYYRIVRPDKTIRTIHAHGELLTDESGEPVKMFGTAQDITDRVHVHEEEMEKLSVAATKSYNSVLIADRKGNIEWVNEGFTSLTGYVLEDVKGTHGEVLRKGSQTGLSQEGSMYAKVMKDKVPFTYENKNYTKSGQEYWVITTLTPVLDKDGDVERIIAIESDITLRKRMEEDLVNAIRIAEHSLKKGSKALDELLGAKRQLEESMKVKEQFLANMSHEIRTPMNAIVGFTALILKTDLNTDQKQYIEAIKTSGENLLVIINDILDFSKIQSGKIVFEEISFRLSQTMAMMTELMLPKSTEKDIKFSIVIDKRIPDNLIGDPVRLNQILLNLVGNGIKFTEKGEVRVGVALLSQAADMVELEFSVSDTGIGIDENKFSSIFESFTQASNETTRRFGGTGLGLAIVKQLVDALGGTISVKSLPGSGSEFVCTLRYKVSPRQEEEQILPDKTDTTDVIKGLNILLVEDNLLNQVLAKKVLTDWKWNVDVAENGLVAVEKVKQNKYDLILMDIQLPEMDGYEATAHIRTKLQEPKSSVPIMAMTAHAMPSEEDKCYKTGMNGYISKPFSQKTLYNRILSVLKADDNNSNSNQKLKHTETKQESAFPEKHTDLAYLRELSSGNKKFVAEMITLFIQLTPEALDKLEKYLESKDWKLLRAIAHKMKPSITFVGIKELESDIRFVEEAAATETNLDKLPGLISKIKTICLAAISELEKELKQHT